MKKNTIRTLHEKVTLLETNNNLSPSTTTIPRFNDIVKVRAFIRPVNGQEAGIYEVIIPMLTILKDRTFSGIRWNDTEYECITAFKEYDTRYVRGNVRRTPSVNSR
ncbi:MAG: hypothetical protein LBJ77_01840 [Holosporales bacterium]|jgi:hypothetical protein|nr:hypothetical protein [Holosporales bacterium]